MLSVQPATILLLQIVAARHCKAPRLKSGMSDRRRVNVEWEQLCFLRSSWQSALFSMIYGRRNDSVDAGLAASMWQPKVRVEESDVPSSRHARRKRPIRLALLMIDPTSRFSLSSWHRRRACAVAVVA